MARGATHHIGRLLKGEQVTFTARVLVTGDPEDPQEVVPVWKLEGREEPETVRYYFQDDTA